MVVLHNNVSTDAVAWNSRPQAPLPTNKMDHEINTVIISFFDDIQNEGFLPLPYDIFKEAPGREIIFWVEERILRESSKEFMWKLV